MKDGFIRVAAATPDIKVADPVFNAEKIWEMIEEGKEKGAKVMVFPELALTGYTCGDLFLQDVLVEKAKEELKKLIKKTEGMDMLAFVGLPWEKNGKLYNVAAAIWKKPAMPSMRQCVKTLPSTVLLGSRRTDNSKYFCAQSKK